MPGSLSVHELVANDSASLFYGEESMHANKNMLINYCDYQWTSMSCYANDFPLTKVRKWQASNQLSSSTVNFIGGTENTPAHL